MKSALWLVVLLPGVGRPVMNEAESLFRGMEARVARARTLQFSFDLETVGVEGPHRLEGTLAREKGNKMKLVIPLASVEEHVISWEIVSDGTNLISDFGGEHLPVRTPRDLDSLISRMVSGAGYLGFVMIFLGSADESSIRELTSELIPSGFKREGRETIGDRPAICVSYGFGARDGKESARVRVWIDEERLLPLQRTVEIDGKVGLREKYTNFLLNEAIEPGRFDPFRKP